MANLRRLLPSLVNRKMFRPIGWTPTAVGGAISLAAALLVFLPFAALAKIALMTTGIMIGTGVISYAVHKAMKPVTDEELMIVASTGIAAKLRAFDNSGNLHRHLDPVAGEFLERAAIQKSRIDSLLSLPEWDKTNATASTINIREQALKTSENALREMLVICSTCIGEPDRTPGSDFQEIIGDVFQMDLAQAIRGFKEFGSGDWTKWSHQSPNRQSIIEPCADILRRLEALADGLEKRTNEMRGRVSSAQPTRTAESIDLILAELSHIEQAEEELDQQIQQQQ